MTKAMGRPPDRGAIGVEVLNRMLAAGRPDFVRRMAVAA